MAAERSLSGVERTFSPDELIVSKTDRTGKITYANDVFLDLAGYEEEEVLGQPHSIIRHPEMPRAVFKLLWDAIEAGEEIFAYVVNRAKNGDHYWVLAHVTPNFDAGGAIIGYHSSRRSPRREAIAKVERLYAAVLAEERRHSDRRQGLEASFRMLVEAVGKAGFDSYDRFILSL